MGWLRHPIVHVYTKGYDVSCWLKTVPNFIKSITCVYVRITYLLMYRHSKNSYQPVHVFFLNKRLFSRQVEETTYVSTYIYKYIVGQIGWSSNEIRLMHHWRHITLWVYNSTYPHTINVHLFKYIGKRTGILCPIIQSLFSTVYHLKDSLFLLLYKINLRHVCICIGGMYYLNKMPNQIAVVFEHFNF